MRGSRPGRRASSRRRVLLLTHSQGMDTGLDHHVAALRRHLPDPWDAYTCFPRGRSFIVVDPASREVAVPLRDVRWVSVSEGFRGNRAAVAPALQRVVDAVDPDIVHVQHMWGFPPDAVARIVRQRPAVLTAHDWFALRRVPFVGWRGPAGADVEAAHHRAMCDVLRQVERVVVPHRAFGDALSAFVAGARFVVIEPGVEPFERRARVSPGERLRFVYLGGRQRHKGWHTLVAAGEALAAEPRVQVFAYGPRTEGWRVGAVQGRGRYDRAELPAILAEADVALLLSNVWETYSTVLSEVWHAGLPVIATRAGVLAHRITDGEDGTLIPPDDPPALVAAMRAALDGSLPSPPSRPSVTVADTAARHAELYRDVFASLGANA